MQSEHEYQKWLKTFYEGSFLAKGWDGVKAEILAALPPEERESAGRAIDELGKLIGAEWAKDNNVRKIDTAALQAWGGQLRAAVRAGGEELRAMIATVETEAKAKLER